MGGGGAVSGAGIAAGLAAAAIWGVNPLFFALLADVPTGELLAHRVLWGAVFVGVWCVLRGRAGRIRDALAGRATRRRLMATAALITVNWLVYLVAIKSGRVAEAGLGYYLMPLVSVGLGVAVLGERLTARQWAAVGLAAAAVALLVAGEGAAPTIPLALAVSFGLYGLLRKRLEVGAVTGFAAEAAMLAPLAAAFLAAVHAGLLPGLGRAAFGADWETTLLLLAAGPVTGLPLILFAEAARRLPYATAGLVQYLNPTLQVASAVFVLGERVSPAYAGALGLVLAGLALYTSALLSPPRRGRPPRPPGSPPP